MIQFSFSPNWYRPQSIAFSQYSTQFYYFSNCILYQYDLKEKKILNEINLKDFLLKHQGYSLSQLLKQGNLLSNKNEEQKCFKKGKLDEKSQTERERQKSIKISAISLIENQKCTFLVAGFNCTGILLLIQFSQIKKSLKVRQIIDVSKQNFAFVSTEYIYIRKAKEENFQVLNEKDARDQVNQIVVFSPNLHKAIITVQMSPQKQDFCIQVNLNMNSLFKQEHSENSQNRNKNKTQQIKLISHEQFSSKADNTEGISANQSQLRHLYNLVFLSLGINNTEQPSQSQNNILVFDHNFQKISCQTNFQSLFQLTHPTIQQKNSHRQSSILSSDSIQFNTCNQTSRQYAILTNNQSEKPNLFCQKFQLFFFNSNLFHFFLSQILSIINPIYLNPSMACVTIQIIYPKKFHHKLSQNQKSNLSIKFIDRQTLLLTGRLGQIFVLNLRQIQLKLQKSPSLQFTLSLRPYSYEQHKNQFWFLEPNQKHYKDIYAIYRVGHLNRQIYPKNSHNITNQKEQKTHETKNWIHMIGTDHILTTWKIAKNQQNPSIENTIIYESSIKFLTSAVEQIVLSQPEPCLVFLRLKDSNIRSFEPFSSKGYWLNEFWKHTCNSFAKEIQKLVMHSTEIGVACMVNKESKIILYDLYEQRLVKLIEIREKVQFKHSQTGNQNANQGKNIRFESIKSKSKEKGFNRGKKDLAKTENQTNKNSVESRLLKINSISFQHVSIINAIQTFYSSEELADDILKDEMIKEGFDFTFQSFYQRELDKNVVLLIQSNEYIFVIRQLSKQYEAKRFHVYRKAFKLERIYKTKYWDGEFMLGTRKKKGQLHVGIIGSTDQKQTKIQDKSDRNSQTFAEKKIELPLGTSSRYLFKLSPLDSDQAKDESKKVLSVINYKGTKLVLLIYRLSLKKTHLITENQLLQGFQEKIGERTKFSDDLSVKELFCSEEIQFPNLSSLNNSMIFIEHLVISQEEDEFLIGIYNNQLETITLIDFKDLISKLVSFYGSSASFNYKYKTELLEEGLIESNPKRAITSLYPEKQLNYKSFQQSDLFIDSNQLLKNSQPNEVDFQSCKHILNIYQLSEFPYKIESIAFHKTHQMQSDSSNDSHLIILGKDQSVRLLPFNLFESHTKIQVNGKKI